MSGVSTTSKVVPYAENNSWIGGIGSAKNAPMKPPITPPAMAAPNATPPLSSIVFALILGLRK